MPSMLLLLLKAQLFLLLFKLHSEFAFFVLLFHAIDIPQNILEYTYEAALFLLLFLVLMRPLLARVDTPLDGSSIHKSTVDSDAQCALVALEYAHTDGVEEGTDAHRSIEHMHGAWEVELMLKEGAELVGP